MYSTALHSVQQAMLHSSIPCWCLSKATCFHANIVRVHREAVQGGVNFDPDSSGQVLVTPPVNTVVSTVENGELPFKEEQKE